MSGFVKTCKECGKSKSISDFYKHPKKADGYFLECKKCWGIRVKAARERNAKHIPHPKPKLHTKLTKDDVMAARELYGYIPAEEIGWLIGVKARTIHAIFQGETWIDS